jgi:hypothetical protein
MLFAPYPVHHQRGNDATFRCEIATPISNYGFYNKGEISRPPSLQ